MADDALPRPAAVAPRKGVRRVLGVALPLLLTVIAALVALEWGLRHFYQLIPLEVCASDNILGTYYCQPYFVYDDPIRIGYRYEPGLEFAGWWDPADPYLTDVGRETAPSPRSDAFWYEFSTDEMGFPNDEDAWQETYDIIVTGDSFTIPTAPETWIELLGEESNKRILTLGAPSWSTLNEVEAVKQYGLDKQPAWVVLMYFEGNDLINTGQYLERQDSGMTWREYDMQGVPFWRRLVIYHLARYLLTPDAREAEPPRYRYPVTASTEAGPVATVFKDIHLLPLSADYETMARSQEFAAVTGALAELQTLTEAQGTRLLLVYVPSKEHIYWSRIWDPVDVNNILERTVTVTLSDDVPGSLQWEPRYLSYDTFQENHDDQERLLTDWAAEQGIPFLNLTPVFWQETIERGELYHYADPHWNQAGNRLAAQTIAAFLRAQEEEP